MKIFHRWSRQSAREDESEEEVNANVVYKQVAVLLAQTVDGLQQLEREKGWINGHAPDPG
jgi:hypothetical protein